ncbi:MAG: dihydroorotate dehydrogenase-like protein [Candidatus Atribacteria bacterium]|nr:dihydroorotate dehydrogenase-like protein [Candidatus Atribacteria bacterium]
MVDLSTTYLGFTLKNPLVVSASPLCEKLDNLKLMEEKGAGAVVLHSLFEEQLTLESLELHHRLSQGTEEFAESLTYLPDLNHYNLGPEKHLEYIQKAKKILNIPLIASLNGTTEGTWVQYAKQMEEAGADALELNIYSLATRFDTSSEMVEKNDLDIIRQVRENISIPLAVKLGPYFSSFANLAKRMEEAGADALVLFNRFYQPDIDVEKLEVVPNLGLSRPESLRLRLRWVAILCGHLKADLAITGGVHSHIDVLKSMMAGAKVAMMTSVLLEKGITYLQTVKDNLVTWMEEHEYQSIQQMQGSMSQKSVKDPQRFERANYVWVLSSYLL